MDEQVVFGFQEQWEAFHERNREFFARFPNLRAAFEACFLRTLYASKPEERVIFALGRLCCEDFYEIILMAGNGYGVGALKLLRGLYERAVTMAYLADHPGETDKFLNYFPVAQKKLLRAIQETIGPDVIPAEAADRTEQQYQSTIDDYMITDCAACGTKRINHTWHKLDIVSMAKRTALGKLIVPAYYIPMRHTHSTVSGLLSRLEETDLGGLGFNPDPQPKEADMALGVSHDIVLAVLEIQMKFFKLQKLEQPLQVCLQDFVDIWKKQDSSSVKPPASIEA